MIRNDTSSQNKEISIAAWKIKQMNFRRKIVLNGSQLIQELPEMTLATKN